MKRGIQYCAAWIAAMGMAASLSFCGKSEPIRLGFVAGLSGRVADLGVAGRNGVMLAIEQKNETGGIHGRSIELLVRDDAQTPETAKQVVSELISHDLEAIIGPMTSSMAMTTLPLVNASKTIMVSPTVTTTELVGKEDNFFRVISTTRDYAAKNARYQFNKYGYRKAAAIYDMSNQSYTESWLRDFRETFEALGGNILKASSFHSGKDTAFYDATKELLSVTPDFVIIIANAVDAALICQQVRKLDSRMPMVLSEWAATERYIELGGAATEGVHVSQFLNRNDTSKEYLTFCEKYRARFGQEPGFAGMAGYDAGQVVIDCLAGRKPGQSLTEAIIQKSVFQGVQQPIIIDRYGDADRATFITIIRDGKYQTVE